MTDPYGIDRALFCYWLLDVLFPGEHPGVRLTEIYLGLCRAYGVDNAKELLKVLNVQVMDYEEGGEKNGTDSA